MVLGPWSRLGVALLAAAALAALPVAYYPALTICAPLAAGLGAARLAESFRRRDGQPRPSGLLLGALALAATTLLLAAPTVLDYFKGFAFRYSLIDQHIGPDRFIAFTETIGLQSFRLANDGPQPPATLVWLAAALAGAFALAGLVLPTKDERRKTKEIELADGPSSFVLRPSSFVRLRWLGLIAAALAYLVWLRFGRPYEYAYMKGSAYAGFVAWGLFALGAQALWRRAGRAARPIVAGLALVPLLTAGWAQALTVRDHWAGPALFRRDIAAFDQDATRLVPRGATVAISGDASLTGPDSGLLCAMLYGREIWGRFAIAYGGHAYWPEGRLPQYALLAAGERAWPLDLGGRELWRSDELALYQLGGDAPTLMGRAEFYSAAPATSRSAPAPLDIWRRGGPNRAAASASPLTLLVGETLRFGPGQPDGGAAVQQLRLTVASLDDQRVAIGSGATTTQLDLRAGVSRLDLPVQAPAAVAIVPESALALIDAATLPGVASAPPSASLDEGQVAWTAATEQRGATIQVRVRLANPGRHALRIALTVVEDTFNSPNSLAQVLAAAPLGDTWQLTLDPARGATEARVGAAPTPMLHASATPNPPDGRYFGVLALYDGEESVAHVPIFTLSMAGGKLAALDPLPFTVEATPAGRPTAPLPGHRRALLDGPARALGDGQAALDAAVLQRWMAWPGAPGDAPLDRGAPLTVQLFWHALQPNARPTMISIQALDRENRKWAQWDGALGGDWRPIQRWQAGERVRQDVPLMFDPATPPGAYRLVLVAYDPATGQAQPLGGENMLSLGELVVR